MNGEIVVTGATGWIGHHVCPLLARRGWRVVGVSRDPAGASRENPDLTWVGVDDDLEGAVQRAGAVLNLAGRNVLEQPWDPGFIDAMRESRLHITQRIVTALGRASAPAPRLVSASGFPVCGDAGDRVITEDHPPSRDLVVGSIDADWEGVALSAAPPTTVTVLRIGLVVGADGGAFPVLRGPFDAGAGVVLGTGEQWLPWIEIDDAARLIADVVEDPGYGAVVNVVAPQPARHRDLARSLGDALGVPWETVVPADQVTASIGGASELLLHSHRMVPARALERGFRYAYPTIEQAVEHLVTGSIPGRPAAASPGPDAKQVEV